MQIQIFQNGAVKGPYSEEQVRQFLAEGRIQPSAMARLNKNAEWSTVDHILTVSAVLATLPLPDVKSSPKPATAKLPPQPTEKAVSKPISRPVSKPIAKPESKPASKTINKYFPKPDLKAEVKSATKPVSKLASKMTPRPLTQSTANPAFTPAYVPPTRTANLGPYLQPKSVTPAEPEDDTEAPTKDPARTTRILKEAPFKAKDLPGKTAAPQNKNPNVVKLSIPAPQRSGQKKPPGQSPSKGSGVWWLIAFILLALGAAGAVGYLFQWDYPSALKYFEDQGQGLLGIAPAPEKKTIPDSSALPTEPPAPAPPQPDQSAATPLPTHEPMPLATPAPTPEVTAEPTPAPTPPPTTPPTPLPGPAPTPSSDQTANNTTPPATPAPVIPPILDTSSAQGYLNRGDAKTSQGDLDGAIADYTVALKLDPKLADAFCDRGLARQSKGDLDGAIADYTQALKLNPNFTIAYRNRGLARQCQGDFDNAISDYTHALSLDTKDVQDYYSRGQLKQTRGDLDGALRDLQEYCQLSPPDDFYSHYAHLYIWVMSIQQKHIREADQELSDAISHGWTSSNNDLTLSIAEFLLGKISEADLMISAPPLPDAKKDAGQHCELWYFAGIKRLLLGDQQTAIDYFRKCVATDQKNYCEYILAQAELKDLKASPRAGD